MLSTETHASMLKGFGWRGPICDEEAAVEPASTGKTIALVVRLHGAADGRWYMSINGANVHQELPLMPLTLVLRFWRSNDLRVLRGTIQLHGSRHSAAIQTNEQIIELIQTWLQSGNVELEG